MGLEILEDAPDTLAVIASIGGGGKQVLQLRGHAPA
jgi:threonine dehydratase